MRILSLVIATAGPLLAGTAEPQSPPAVERYPSFREIVQDAKSKVFPSVVYIKVVVETNEAGKKATAQSSGSGVIISSAGDVLTNWHVIDQAVSVRCLLSDGRHCDAEIVGSDQDTDLALVKLRLADSADLPHAVIGDSTQLTEGDFVMAMGAPWGMNRSVSIGIVSCTRRYLEDISEYSLWLQTDAAINPGNSGGPLVNTAGEIVGLNTRGSAGSAEGLGFAIPSETIAILLPQLREHGVVRWSWTGLQLQPLRDFDRDMYFEETRGVIVSETDPDSPARRAGLQPRDRIVRVNGYPLTCMTSEDLPAVQRWLALLPRGEPARVEIVRDGERSTITLTPREKGEVEGEELALERFDLTLKAINQFDNPQLFFHRPEGVFVFGVRHPGNAANAGLREGDILLEIDNEEIVTIDDARRAHERLLEGVESRHRVLVVVLRGGNMRQLVIDFARDYSK